MNTKPVEAGAVAKDVPEWVHLLPLGQITGRDGRTYTLSNPDTLLAAFEMGNIDLPIDFEHQSETYKDKRTGPIPVAGWIKELKIQSDGVWGRVEWTREAHNMIQTRQYRYISPVMNYLKGGEVVRLKSAALVHHPNLELTALSSEEETMDEERSFLHELAKMLGLADGASKDEILKAVKAIKDDTPDPAKYVPIEAMQSVMEQSRTAVIGVAEDRAEAKVSMAMEKGHISPAMKDWALALCTQDEASFDSFIEGTAPMFGQIATPLSHMAGLPPSSERVALMAQSETAKSICAQLGLDETALND